MAKKAVIIGGGHNGLVCAAYLAKAGMDVTVLERRSILGGAAVTEEFHPGFRNSVCSYTVSLLHPCVIADLDLHAHGLRVLPRQVNNFLPLPDGDSFASFPGKLADEVARFASEDVAALESYESLLSAIVPVIKDIMLITPPAIDEAGLSDLVSLFRLSRKFGQLNRVQKQFLLALFGRSAGEILDDFFTGNAIKALLGFDAIVGNFVSPYTPGNGYNLLHHLVGEVNGESGRWGHAIGGMGAISDAITAEGAKYGARYHTKSEVTGIAVECGRVSGVLTADGEVFDADIVAAGINPQLLFQRLLEPEYVSEEVQQHFNRYKCASGAFRMNVALSGLPDYSGRQVPHCMEAGIIMAPTLDYMDRAWHSARVQGWSASPVVEMLIPSIIDNSLAPEGCHVASLFCQHFNPALGEQWSQNRDLAAAAILDVVEQHFPGFRGLVQGMQVLSPWDLEQEFGLLGGDIFHGRLSLDQLFSSRPGLGLAQYSMPVKGLYLCGSGAHPGGGVSGLPGRNAALKILG